jgi:hypothetical protein
MSWISTWFCIRVKQATQHRGGKGKKKPDLRHLVALVVLPVRHEDHVQALGRPVLPQQVAEADERRHDARVPAAVGQVVQERPVADEVVEHDEVRAHALAKALEDDILDRQADGVDDGVHRPRLVDDDHHQAVELLPVQPLPHQRRRQGRLGGHPLGSQHLLWTMTQPGFSDQGVGEAAGEGRRRRFGGGRQGTNAG